MITIWVPKRLVEIDLCNVAARSGPELAAACEESYARRLRYAARKIRQSGAKIIMLTGPSASGKTTTSHKLAAVLREMGTPAQVISLDNFFRGSEYYPRMPDGTLDYEHPDTLDMPLIRQCLQELSQTDHTVLPTYDFVKEERAEKTEPIDLAGGVCIVEGIHALNPMLTSLVPSGHVYRIYAGLPPCAAGRRHPGPQPRKDPCHVGAGAGRRDAVHQGLQEHGGLSAGHGLHLRAGHHRRAAARGGPGHVPGQHLHRDVGRDGPPLRARGAAGPRADPRGGHAAGILPLTGKVQKFHCKKIIKL